MSRRPTAVRHEVVGIATVMAVLLYLDRNCLPFAAIYIKEDLHLTDVQLGWVISAFYLSYALGQVPAGWLTDRCGARLMLALYVFLWSVFMGLTGAAVGLVSLLTFRLAMGLGQAGAYPTGANLISKWVPFSNRGFASSIVSFGGRLGGSLAPLLTGYLIVAFTPVAKPSFMGFDDILSMSRLRNRLVAATATDDANASPIVTPAAVRAAVLLRDVLPHDQSWRDIDELSLRNAINEVIRRPDAFSVEDVKGLTLENEAVRLGERRDAELSQVEVERRNRLILEAAFPDAFRKLYGTGWRWVMFAYGAMGAVIALACWIITRDRPADHPRVNDAELDLIQQGRPSEASITDAKARGGVPLGPLLGSRSLWLSCISQCFTNIGWIFLVAWLPTYLERVHNTPIEKRAWLVLIPFTIGWIGMLLGGRLTDRLVRLLGLRWGRALPMGLTRFLAMAAYLVCLGDVPMWIAVAAFSVVAFATDLGTAAVWAFCQDVGGPHVGSVLGWGNMWGNLGAFVTPPVLIWIVGDGFLWDRAFLACAAAFFLAGVTALGIDATIPIGKQTR